MGRWLLLDLRWVSWYVSHFGRQINCDVGCKEGEEENEASWQLVLMMGPLFTRCSRIRTRISGVKYHFAWFLSNVFHVCKISVKSWESLDSSHPMCWGGRQARVSPLSVCGHLITQDVMIHCQKARYFAKDEGPSRKTQSSVFAGWVKSLWFGQVSPLPILLKDYPLK